MSIRFSVELHFVICLAPYSTVDVSPMCIFLCISTSTRSQSTLLLYHSTSGSISTSRTSEKNSPLFYLLTTTATSAASALASLSSPVCYCPCSTTASTCCLLCTYWYRKREAYSQTFPENILQEM